MRAVDISRGRQILTRFLALAEERLAYLSELYETGRWKRYFTQEQLLDNVREARSAVDAWRLLVSTEALPNNRPVNLDWLNTGRPLPPRKPLMIHADQPPRPAPRPVAREPEFVAEPASVLPSMPAFASRFAGKPPTPKPAPAPTRLDFREAAAPIRLKTPPPLPAPVLAATKSPQMPPKNAAWQNALDAAAMRDRYPLLRKTG